MDSVFREWRFTGGQGIPGMESEQGSAVKHVTQQCKGKASCIQQTALKLQMPGRNTNFNMPVKQD